MLTSNASAIFESGHLGPSASDFNSMLIRNTRSFAIRGSRSNVSNINRSSIDNRTTALASVPMITP